MVQSQLNDFPNGIPRPQLAAFVDWYSNGELRLPPNPICSDESKLEDVS